MATDTTRYTIRKMREHDEDDLRAAVIRRAREREISFTVAARGLVREITQYINEMWDAVELEEWIADLETEFAPRGDGRTTGEHGHGD